MNAPFSFPTDELFKATKAFQMPEQVRAMAEEGVAQSRKAYTQFAGLAEYNAKATQDVFATVQDGAKTITTKVFENVSTNTDAVMKAASEIARAKSVPDALRLQAEFMQAQMSLFAAQSQELFRLSAGVSKTAADKMGAVATRAADQFKSGV